jgi:hypothetical protein
MASRRGVLKLIGGGVVLAAVAGGGWYVANNPSKAARAAWKEAGTPAEKRRRFLSYALLAPNPHNRQPWLVELLGEDELTLYCDLDRRLPETDPFDRQIVTGCGAFLELFALAAASEGYRAEITPFPEGGPALRLDARPVARVRLLADAAERDPAFDQILKRRTNRNNYEAREVAADVRTQLEAAGSTNGFRLRTTGEGELAGKLRDLTWRAHEREMLTHHTLKESVDLMRIGNAEIERYRDGISLDGQMIAFASMAGMISREALLDPKSEAFKMGMDQYREMAASARSFAWLTGPEGRTAEIDAGRAYARFALKAAELGLAVHPWSQSLQEFAEMRPLYDEVHSLIGGGERVHMLVRIGYAAADTTAPRRGLGALFRETGQA